MTPDARLEIAAGFASERGPRADNQDFGGVHIGDDAEQRVHGVIAVIADEGADASLALHRRAGFVEAGHLTRTGEKFGRQIGVYFLQRELTPPAERG